MDPAGQSKITLDMAYRYSLYLDVSSGVHGNKPCQTRAQRPMHQADLGLP